jgi:hypothetical protein
MNWVDILIAMLPEELLLAGIVLVIGAVVVPRWGRTKKGT